MVKRISLVIDLLYCDSCKQNYNENIHNLRNFTDVMPCGHKFRHLKKTVERSNWLCEEETIKELEKIYTDCNDERVFEIQNRLGDLLKEINNKIKETRKMEVETGSDDVIKVT